MRHTEMRRFLLEANRANLSPAEKDVFLYYQSRGRTWDCPDNKVAVEIGRSRNSVCEARNKLKTRHWIAEKTPFQIDVLKVFSVENATEKEPEPVGNATGTDQPPVENATPTVGNSTDQSETRLEMAVNVTNEKDLQAPKRNIEEKEVNKKRVRPRDTRLDHPAIISVHQVTGKWPDKDLFDVLIDTLGFDVDATLLKQCWVDWRAKGFSPRNFAWALEWYPQGGVRNGTNRQNFNNGRATTLDRLRDQAGIPDKYPSESESIN